MIGALEPDEPVTEVIRHLVVIGDQVIGARASSVCHWRFASVARVAVM